MEPTYYGTWADVSYSPDLIEHVRNAFGWDGPQGYDFDAIVGEYQRVLNNALPDGVFFYAGIFMGPAWTEFEGYPVDAYGRLDIPEIIDSINLDSIIDRHKNPVAQDISTGTEKIALYPNPHNPVTQSAIRIRKDTVTSYSISLGGATANGETGSWISLTGLTPEMLAQLPAMINDFLSEDSR